MSATVVVDTDPEAVAAIAAAINAASLVAFDLEFLAQDRLVPTLCLVQVAWTADHEALDASAAASGATRLPEVRLPDGRLPEVRLPEVRLPEVRLPEVRLIDPLAVDVGPVIRALAAHPCVVAHAPRQDLAILSARFGVAMPRVIDTQVMAAFAGIGDQIGFAALANELLGLSLGKEQQWTDWGARPLSDAQLTYAAADVRYLPEIYARLAARLGDRLAWARAESTEIAADAVAAAAVTAQTAWRQIGGLRGLDALTLATVVELAAWRQQLCVELDRPLGQVLPDKLVIDLARQRPATVVAVRNVKGMPGLARQHAEAIAGAIAAARADQVTPIAAARPPSQRAQRWAELLIAIVQLVAEQLKVAPRLLATRADAEELARTVDERGLAAADALPALTTWRRDVIGRAWRGWLTGELVLIGDALAPHGVRLVVRYDQPTQ